MADVCGRCGAPLIAGRDACGECGLARAASGFVAPDAPAPGWSLDGTGAQRDTSFPPPGEAGPYGATRPPWTDGPGPFLPPGAGPLGPPVGPWTPSGPGPGPGQGPGPGYWAPPPWGAGGLRPGPAPSPSNRRVLLIVGAIGAVVVLIIVLGVIAGQSPRTSFDPTASGPYGPYGTAVRPFVDEGFEVAWQTDLDTLGLEPSWVGEDDTRLGMVGDTVAMIAEDGRLVGFDVATGRVRWETLATPDGLGVTHELATGDTLRPRPNVLVNERAFDLRESGADLFFVTRHGHYFAVDAASGKAYWSEYGYTLLVSPTNPEVFTLGERGFYKMRRTSLDQVWGHVPKGQPAVTAGAAVVLVIGTEITALDREKGTTLWETPSPLGTVKSMIEAGDAVVVVGDNGGVAAFDVSTGAQRWSLPATSAKLGGDVFEVVASADDQVIVHDLAGNVRSLATTDGHERWRTALAGWHSFRSRIGQRHVVLSDAQGVVVLDRDDGTEVARYEGDLIGGPASDGDHTCLIESNDFSAESGTLTCLTVP